MMTTIDNAMLDQIVNAISKSNEKLITVVLDQLIKNVFKVAIVTDEDEFKKLVEKLKTTFVCDYIDRQMKNTYTKQTLEKHLNIYIQSYLSINELNTELKSKLIRKEIFPCEITENLVKFAIIKKYNVVPCWEKGGDLWLNGKRLEVKGSLDLLNDSGPTSFGPKKD